ncbi:hypothetical protein Tco_0587897, partial [Tanacetum coccineum]
TPFGFLPFQFTRPERRLTMEEILDKFIDEGKQEYEEIIEVHGLTRVMNDVLILKNKVKGVTTRGGKTTTGIAYNGEINNVSKEPSELPHDRTEEPRDVIVQNEP